MTEPTKNDGTDGTPAAPAAPDAADKPDVAVVNVKSGDQQQVGDPVHEQKPAATGPQMPEGGHEKYWNAEAGQYNWEAHAKELAWQGEQKAAADGEKVDAEKLANADEAAGDVAKAAGVDIDEFNTYVAENGEVSPEHLKAFEAAGIPTDAVKEYVQLKIDQADRHLSAVEEYFGGESAMANMNQHLAKNYTKAEIEAFNEQLMQPGTWRTTAAFLLQDAGMPRAGKGLIKAPNAQGGAANAGEKFASEAEFNSAMRDPRYKTDPAFRTRVQNTLRNSPHLMGR